MLFDDIDRSADLPWHPDFDHTLLAPADTRHAAIVTENGRVPDHLWGSVLMLGNFDGLHAGHLTLLRLARRVAALMKAPLGVMSCEPHPRQFFDPKLIGFRLSSADTKKISFARLGIDILFMPNFNQDFASQSPSQFILQILVQRLGVRAVVVGSDFRFGGNRAGDVDLLEKFGNQLGFAVLTVPDYTEAGERISSTQIRRWISAGLLEEATTALGESWLVPASVDIEGRLIFDAAFLLPPEGSYHVNVWSPCGEPLGGSPLEISKTSAQLLVSVKQPFTCLLAGWRKLRNAACALDPMNGPA